MRLLGTILMWFGAFLLATAGLELFGEPLRAAGIDVFAWSTSTVGTALIGGFALLSGVLLRRRSVEERARRAGREAARHELAEQVEAPEFGAGAREKDAARPER